VEIEALPISPILTFRTDALEKRYNLILRTFSPNISVTMADIEIKPGISLEKYYA
jgi:hypothetical protein